jgi:methanogenic corrinoid protein MtbC1
MMVQLLGVRPVVLVNWEQQYGIPSPTKVRDDTGGIVRHYSERDLAAMTWLRDQLTDGMLLADAMAQLVSAQQPPAVARPTAGTRPLGDHLSGALGPSAASQPHLPDLYPMRGQGGTGALTQSGATTGSLYGRAREPRLLMQELVRAFVTFDTTTAHRLVSEALGARNAETVCMSLLLPALQRVSEMWARREASPPEERFAQNYVRGFLFAEFHHTFESPHGPTVFVTCAPREFSDISALTLAMFWRKAGLRVIYLGQDADAPSLVEEVRKRRPALVALAATSAQRVRTLGRIAREVSQIEAPRPIFGFYGPMFVRNPELKRKVGGVYLGDDPATATFHLRSLLSMNTTA